MKRAHVSDDRGSAIVEFLGLGVMLLVPLLYLIAALGRVQSASFAAEGAARDGARAVTVAPDERTARARLDAITRLALLDQGLAHAPHQVQLRCRPDCTSPDAVVSVAVSVQVALPGVPVFVDSVLPSRVPIRAEANARVDRFR